MTLRKLSKILTKRLMWLTCDWFVNNKLTIQSGDDKTKDIFDTTYHLNKAGGLDIRHGGIQMKQYHAVT